MFDIQKIQLVAQVGASDLTLQTPDAFGLFRTDNGAHLGTVQKGYHVIQNSEIMHTFRKACDVAQVDHSNIKFVELNGGRKVAFQLPTDNWSINGDAVERYMTVCNGHDGNSSFGFGFTGVRVYCQNTWWSALRSKSVSRFKHTASLSENFHKLAHIVLASLEENMILQEAYTALDNQKFTVAEIDGFALAVLGYDSDEIQDSTRKFNKFKTLKQGIEIELDSIGGTRWGAFNGVTYATNHLFSKDDQLNYLMFNDGATLNSRALQLLSN
jgi:phage/plasmid-like protein (TIGR03299 family)